MRNKPKVTKKQMTIMVAAFLVLATTLVIIRGFYLRNCAVQSEEDAVTMAKVAFIDTYGAQPVDMTFIAEHDVWSGTWYVHGCVPLIIEVSEGYTITKPRGVPHAIIRERDGKIMRIWHDKG